MRVKNTVAIVKTTVLPVIHKTYNLKQKQIVNDGSVRKIAKYKYNKPRYFVQMQIFVKNLQLEKTFKNSCMDQT